MNTSTATSIATIGFRNPRLQHVGIDVLTLQEVRERAPQTLLAPQRVDFYFLMLIEAGRCRHTVDFVEYALRPGSVVFLQPGQVQQWHMHAGVQGVIVLVADQAMVPPVGRSERGVTLLRLDQWPAAATLSTGLFLQAHHDAMRLRNEVLHCDGSERESAILWYGVLALLLRVAKALKVGDVPAAAQPVASIYRLFCQALETGFRQRLTVQDYANKLGYSHSTLNRVCMAAVHLHAKDVVDKRVVLEAKRLLVHSQATTASIGYQLGFLEPSNFVKFFRRLTGHTPGAYRQAQLQRSKRPA